MPLLLARGISRGWATKELYEKALKALVLERGRMVKHIEDYPTMNDDPSDQSYKGQLSVEERNNNLYKRGLVGHPKRTISIFS
jgi:hypothetical protein